MQAQIYTEKPGVTPTFYTDPPSARSTFYTNCALQGIKTAILLARCANVPLAQTQLWALQWRAQNHTTLRKNRSVAGCSTCPA